MRMGNMREMKVMPKDYLKAWLLVMPIMCLNLSIKDGVSSR